MTEVIPTTCPRCGSDVKQYVMHNYWHVLTCNGCNATVTGTSEEQSVTKWNKRSHEECPHCGEGGEVKRMCYSNVDAVASYAVACKGCGCSVADKTESGAVLKWRMRLG